MKCYPALESWFGGIAKIKIVGAKDGVAELLGAVKVMHRSIFNEHVLHGLDDCHDDGTSASLQVCDNLDAEVVPRFTSVPAEQVAGYPHQNHASQHGGSLSERTHQTKN